MKKMRDKWGNKMKRLRMGVAIVLLAALAWSFGFYLRDHMAVNGGKFTALAANFDVTPVSADMAGMAVDSPIKITSKEPVTLKQIQDMVHVFPQEPYSIAKQSDREFLIFFHKPLAPGSIYRVNLKSDGDKGLTWAFQTKREFKVVRTLPRDKAVHVPVDSGIEIQFSFPGVKPVDDYFEITPRVEGRFEYHKNTAVFVHKGLKYDTLYTVKIKAGLGLKDSQETLSGDYVFKFKTMQDPGSHQGYLSFYNELFDITTKSPAVLEAYIDQQYRNKQFQVTVYRYKDKQDFIKNMMHIDDSKINWYDTPSARVEIDPGKMEKVMEFAATLKPSDQQMWDRVFLIFPQNLEVGDYLVNLSCEDKVWQTHVQVNDLAVYAMVGEKENLIWANDINTGKPVQGALVKDLSTRDSSLTGADGIAVIKAATPLDKDYMRAYFEITPKAGHPFLVRAKLQSDVFADYYYYSAPDTLSSNAYWSYLYLDRGMYLPNDRINIWGMVKPRDGGLLTEGTLTLNRPDNSGGFAEIDRKQIKLSDFGTFEGNFEMNNFLPGSYSIDFKAGDEVILRKYFSVREYTKPAYRLDIKADKDKIFAWESAKLSINASFFEGTPVSGLKLDCALYEQQNQIQNTLQCDENGDAGFVYRPGIDNDEWYPVSTHYNIRNADPEDEEIYAYGYIMVFPRDVMINIKTRASGDKTRGFVTIDTNKIDLNKQRTDAGTGEYWDRFKGDAVDMDLEVRIYEKIYDRQEIGEYYDFINKKVVKKYNYIESRELVDTINTKSRGGRAYAEFAVQPERNYEIEVRGKDTRGRNVLASSWFMMYDFYGYYNRDRYELSTGDEEKKYRLGEAVDIKLKYNREDVSPTDKGRLLLMVLKDGLKDYRITGNTGERFTFSRDFVPNTFIGGVYFDGRRIFRAGVKNLCYDYKEMELKIEVKPERLNYRPKDTVKLDVTVKKPDGTPVQSEVNLSVVDESFFALEEQHVDTPGSIYGYNFRTGICLDYVSYRKVDLLGAGGAEKGGEGGYDTVRQDFRDTAFFKSVRTDANGKASIAFRLPDNLTSWRVTYQALTPDLYAASGKLNINARLPFFANLIMSGTYMEGDTPSISIRSFGSKINSGDIVDYTVKLADDSGNVREIKKSGAVNSFTSVSLGKLASKNYSLTVEARCGSYFDGIKRDFTVAESTLDVLKTDYLDLKSDIKIPSSKGFTILNFYNKKGSLYHTALLDLKYSWGMRVDQMLAEAVAGRLLDENFEEKGGIKELDLGKYQIEDGGIALLPYSSSEPGISARVASLGGGFFDENALKGYFYGIIENRKSPMDDVMSALWGLAALQEPVLTDIKYLMERESLNATQQLIAAIALAEIGDEAEAQKIYTKIIDDYGEQSGSALYINAGGDINDILEQTSLAAVLSTKLGAAERYELFSYLLSSSGDKLLTNLEQLICIAEDIPDAGGTAHFTYVLDGVKKRISLEGNRGYTLLLKPDQAEKVRFEDIEGDVAVAASYPTGVQGLGKTDGNIALTRNYAAGGQTKDEFEPGQMVKVVLTPEFGEAAPEGFYEITDILPSAFRYVRHTRFDTKICYPIKWSGQKVVFGYYYSKKAPVQSIVYYARAAVPGEYTADHAVMKHINTNTTAIAGKKTIVVESSTLQGTQ